MDYANTEYEDMKQWGIAWSNLDSTEDEHTRFVAVLEIPPVESAETAVRVQIVKDFKTSK